MKTGSTILIIFFLAVGISCSKEQTTPKNSNDSAIVLKQSTSDYYSLISSPSSQNSDPFQLGPISVNGNTVEVTVSYAGGCAKHSFNIIWDEMVEYSDPPKINIVITHDANGDNCEAYITEVLKFNIDSLVTDITIPDVGIDGYSGWDGNDSTIFEIPSYDFTFSESDTCNLEVTATEAICGWGLYGNVWFALKDSVSSGNPDFYFKKFLRPESTAESLKNFVPVSGKKYIIGAVINKSSENFSDVPVCMAYPGPSVPIKIMCIKEAG